MALTLFAERGYNATTMDDTAEAAGVTKPLLYQHFDSKRALYLELVDSRGHRHARRHRQGGGRGRRARASRSRAASPPTSNWW